MDDYLPEDKLNENEIDIKASMEGRKWRIVWHNIAFFVIQHTLSCYAIYLCFTSAMWTTMIYSIILINIGSVGVTAGAHRLWTHKAYKAKLPLKLLLLWMYTLSFEGTVHDWVRDHRMHHKHCDTDADPHNSTRGFFFSHIGWLLVKKHPEMARKKHTVDMSDIVNDPILNLQHKYKYLWVLLISAIIPTLIPLLWGENFWTSLFITVNLRHTVGLHIVFLVNSAAHTFGSKPYDKSISSVENNIISFLTTGEGFHNYHHTFPWDYRTAELGGYKFNITRLFIDLMAKIGWAYDLKTVSEEVIEKRVKRTGDGSHPVWGWDDKDLKEEHRKTTKILYKI